MIFGRIFRGINLAIPLEQMRAQAFGLLTSVVLLSGVGVVACGSSSDDSSSPGGGATAGTNSGVGGGHAGTTSTTGSAGTYATGGGGATSSFGGTSGLAGTGGGFAQAGAASGGTTSAGGTSNDGGSSSGGKSSSGGSTGTAGSSSSGGMTGAGGAPSVPTTKLVVYIDDWTGSYSSWATKVDFSKMTHLNLAFYTATTGNNWQDSSGQSDSDVKALVTKAHAAGVKVLVSLGGGGGDSTVVNQYKNTANDDALVSNLDALISRLDLDGADIDIEKESQGEVGDLYATFVSKVIAKLHPEGKLVTAAVAQYLQPYMNDDTLHSFDFVNIMIYSSNTSDYTSQANYYVNTKGMAKSKITLGIISESDQHTSTATTTSIMNIAKNYGGGMLWDLAEDNTGSTSTYKAMQNAM